MYTHENEKIATACTSWTGIILETAFAQSSETCASAQLKNYPFSLENAYGIADVTFRRAIRKNYDTTLMKK